MFTAIKPHTLKTKPQLFRAALNDRDLRDHKCRFRVLSVDHTEQTATVKLWSRFGIRHPDPRKRCKRTVCTVTFELL